MQKKQYYEIFIKFTVPEKTLKNRIALFCNGKLKQKHFLDNFFFWEEKSLKVPKQELHARRTLFFKPISIMKVNAVLIDQ